MIRKFRPFWSYDILKTEAWLNKMSLNGYHLKHINFISRIFVFEKDKSMNIRYHICYEKSFNGQLSAQMVNAGWECLLTNSRFCVLRTTCENPTATPSYENILERNRKIKLVVGIILLIIICLQLPMLLIFGIVFLIVLTGNFTVEYSESLENAPQAIDVILGTLIPFAVLLSISWLVYTFFKLRASNKYIETNYSVMPNLSFTIPTAGLMSKIDEKLLIKSKKMIRKGKLAWFYAPDKAEHWLEEMELKGYNLYRMSKTGSSFYFIKGAPRKMKYAVDYQNKTGPSYFAFNTECGWKLVFTSLSRSQAITVWSHEYIEDENIPEFYSDDQSKIKHAKRFALTYSLCFLPACILYIAIIIIELYTSNGNTIPWATLLIFTLLVIESVAFAFTTIFYYFRVKKKLETK